MALTRLSLAVLSIFAFCAVWNVESTTILLDTSFEKVHVLVTNDLNYSVTIEGEVFGQGHQVIEIANAEKKNLTFQRSGMVIVTEDGQAIVRADVGGRAGFSLVKTHSEANLTEVLGNISISQNTSNLELKIHGDKERKHSFYLFEGESVYEQMVRTDGNNITVRNTLVNQQAKQDLFFLGVCQPLILVDKNKSEKQEMFIGGRGAHGTTLEKKYGVTTVKHLYYF